MFQFEISTLESRSAEGTIFISLSVFYVLSFSIRYFFSHFERRKQVDDFYRYVVKIVIKAQVRALNIR